MLVYNNIIQPHPDIVGNKFDGYRDIQHASQFQSDDETLNQLRQMSLIEENVVQLEIFFEQPLVSFQEDEPRMDLISYLVNAAALLNSG